MVEDASNDLRRSGLHWIWLRFPCVAAALQLASTPTSMAAPNAPEDTWASLADEIFKGRPLADGTGLVAIEMPSRAEDAAIVPVTMRVTLAAGRRAAGSRRSRW